MFQKSTPLLKMILACLLAVGISSCSWVEDSLDDCPTGCKIRFRPEMEKEYGGLFNAAAFYNEVKDIGLFVFDSKGIYVGSYSGQGEILKQNNFIWELPLQPGHYKMVAWAGLADGFYEVSALKEGVSTMQDLTLRMARDADNRQDEQITPLWHGIIEQEVEVKEAQLSPIDIYMLKNTKTLVTVIQDMWGNNLEADDFTFEIIADNGLMDYRNQLLSDPQITYGAYFTQTGEVDISDNEFLGPGISPDKKFKVARAELNTLRLMTDKNTRFVVTEKATGRQLMNINLTTYLLLTRKLYEGKYGVKITDRKYLDYEDTFSVIFFLTPQGDGAYAFTTISINGWIIRLNNAEL